MKIKSRSNNPLAKRARKGFRGFPVATVAFYGPDDQRASKLVIGIINHEGAEQSYADGIQTIAIYDPFRRSSLRLRPL